jgi:MFS family permease
LVSGRFYYLAGAEARPRCARRPSVGFGAGGKKARMDRNRAPFVALVASDALSLAGSVVAALAIPWFVLTTTGSPAKTGIAAFFATVPLAVSALLSGGLVDRVGARRASVVADLLAGASIAAIPALHAVGRLEYWHILVLAFASGAFDGPGRAARLALLPDLANRAQLPLERANGIARFAEHGGYVLGAPAAGVLIATVGAPGALWIDSLSFVVSAATIFVAVAPTAAAGASSAGYLRELASGLGFIARDPVLRTLLTMASLGSFCIAPLSTVLLPVYAREQLDGAADYAALIAAYGAGGLAGAALFSLVGMRVSRRLVYVGTWGVALAASVALLFLPQLVLAVVTLFVLGVAAGAISPLEQTVWQERTPKELRGRAFAASAAIPLLTDALAFVVAGAIVGLFGLRAGLAVHAVGDAILFAAALTLPAIRKLDSPRAPTSARRAPRLAAEAPPR